MDEERARELLGAERSRIEAAIASLAGDASPEPGDRDSEDLFERELDSGLRRDLSEQLAAVERAEARLAAGSYGLSVQSGLAIPDGRLEAVPTAERTVEEEQASGG